MTKSDIIILHKKSRKSNMFFGKSSHLRKTCKTAGIITDLITFLDTFLTKTMHKKSCIFYKLVVKNTQTHENVNTFLI